MEIRNDISVNQYQSGYTGYETPKVSSNETAAQSAPVNTETAVAQVKETTPKSVPTPYETMQQKMQLASDLDKLISMVMPERGIQFKIHEDTGTIITSVIDRSSKEVIREFPAEKILDMVYSMCSKMGMIVNKKI